MTSPHATRTPHWSTSSFSDHADTATQEVSALHEHLRLCNGLHGRLFRLRCGLDATQRFVTSRFVTTLVGAALLIALVGWLT